MNKTRISESIRADRSRRRNRFIAGGVVFVTGQLAPLAIPLVVNSSLSASWKTALSGLLLLGLPEIAIVLSIMILGKAGFDALKSRLFGPLKNWLLPDKASRSRYYVGLVLFLIPLLFGWLAPYIHSLLPEPMHHRLALAIIGDVTLIVGVCMMGGQFWDKLRALVAYDAEVTFRSKVGELTS